MITNNTKKVCRQIAVSRGRIMNVHTRHVESAIDLIRTAADRYNYYPAFWRC